MPEAPHSLEKSAGTVIRSVVRQEFEDAGPIGSWRRREYSQECRDLGCEDKTRSREGEIQWLDPEAIAGNHERSLGPIKHRKRPHPVELVQPGFPPLLPGVKEHFGVCARVELASQCLQFVSQFDVVEYLSIEH